MIPRTVRELSHILDGVLSGPEDPGPVSGLTTDTRTIRDGEVFLALQGDRFDGHHFLEEARRRGARAAIVSDPPLETPLPLIRVRNTLDALKRLGAWNREQCRGPVLAVTGSNGKSTVRSLIAHVLRERGRVVEAEKSFNNVIGVSLTLLKISSDTDAVVLEMGTNHPGEIAELCAVASPTWAVLTNIGRSHLEAFKDEQGVLKEKMALPSWPTVVQRVFCADDPLLREACRDLKGGSTGFGLHPQAQARAAHIRSVSGWRTEVQLSTGLTYTLSLPGLHNGLNSLAALAVGRLWGIEDALIARALEKGSALPHRCEVKVAAGVEVIDDTYNANPSSLKASLEMLCAGPVSGRRILLLGEMRELGDKAQVFHEEMGHWAGERGVDALVAVGPLAHLAREAFQKTQKGTVHPCPEDVVELTAWLRPGDVLLAKGSRASGMDQWVDRLLTKLTEEERARQCSTI